MKSDFPFKTQKDQRLDLTRFDIEKFRGSPERRGDDEADHGASHEARLPRKSWVLGGPQS